MRGEARLKAGAQGTRGAHFEHVGHGYEAGGIEAQRLVERQRALPRVESRAYGAGRGVCRPGGGRRRATAAHAACRGGLDCRFGVGHGEERTRNMPHMFVTLEVVSKLNGWLNLYAYCRAEERASDAGRRAGQEKGWPRATAARAACRGDPGCRFGAGHGEERTRNM